MELMKRTYNRRKYNVNGPNDLRHLGTNHKLIRWVFVIVRAVNDFSQLPVVLTCTDNNKVEIILKCFVDGVNDYGLPSRSKDQNVVVADCMFLQMGVGRMA